MRVHNSDFQQRPEIKNHSGHHSDGSNFSRLLKKDKLIGQKIDVFSDTQAKNLVELGTLSKSLSSVAQLLLQHPQLQSNTWSIIHNDLNKNKAFRQIPVGTTIYYDNTTRELKWDEAGKATNKITATQLKTHSRAQNHGDLNTNLTADSTAGNTQKIILGQLDHDHPTISNLLINHHEFKSSSWNIIHSAINKNKAFTKIPSGSTVYIDAKTKELTWQTPKNTGSGFPADGNDAHSDNMRLLAKKLDDAVKPFMGTPYEAIDCYTLVVHGLKNMGVRYTGQDSLSRQLLHRAKIEGRADNAYFTGEGITEALGEKIYTKDIVQVQDVKKQSMAIFDEMKALMKKGDILSFSLESKGHTGIISQNQDQWTYINSGRLDNSIAANAPSHGVGEETLLKEISNWVKLAKRRRQSLQITVGRLDNQKLV